MEQSHKKESYREKIIKLLTENTLTVEKLATQLNISKKDVRIYLHRIRKDNNYELKELSYDGRYKIYKIIPNTKKEQEFNSLDTDILKKILPKFIELEVHLKNTTEQQDKRIEELIKKCL